MKSVLKHKTGDVTVWKCNTMVMVIRNITVIILVRVRCIEIVNKHKLK